MLWHFSNRNIGATSLILWLLLLNFQSFLNALLWPHDDTAQWFGGTGLCDVEVKLMIAASVGVPSSVASVLRALARVMDTEKASLGLSNREKRRGYAIDLLWCVGFPVLQMFFHYVVQSERYYIVGIAGCAPAADDSWVTDSLIFAPPVGWTLVGGYYSSELCPVRVSSLREFCWLTWVMFAALVLIRLHRYRRNFTSLLAHSNTNRSRFVRLFAICIVWLAVSIPLEIYAISKTVAVPHVPFSWASVHDPAKWNTIEKIPSGGRAIFTRYVWLGSAVMVFLFFGFGRDASRMYAKGLRGMGLGRCLPFLNDHHQRTPARTASHTGTMNSVSSKARLLFGRKGSSSTSHSVKSWAADSRSSKTTDYSIDEPLSPKTMKHLETVEENSRMQTQMGSRFESMEGGNIKSRYAFWLGERRFHAAADVEKNLPAVPEDVHPRLGFQRLTSPFRPASLDREAALPMDVLKTHGVTVKSTVAAGPLSPESRVAPDMAAFW